MISSVGSITALHGDCPLGIDDTAMGNGSSERELQTRQDSGAGPVEWTDAKAGSRGHPFATLPGFALWRVANMMTRALSTRLSTLDLRISDAAILLTVQQRRDMTSSEIGKQLDIQRANMVPFLHRLEEAGLIMREPIDRKSQAIVLTVSGQEKLDAVHALIADFEAELMEPISLTERGHLLAALHALVAWPSSS